MSDVKTVEVGGRKYNFAQASAVEQKTLLMIVGLGIVVKKMSGDIQAAKTGADPSVIDSDMLLGFLLSLDEGRLDKVAEIVLGKCIPSGGDRPVDIYDFQGQIENYLSLIAEGVKVNLNGFFTLFNSGKINLVSLQKNLKASQG